MIALELGPQEQIAADQFRGFYAKLLALRDEIVPLDPTTAAAVRPPSLDAMRTRLAQEITDLGYRHDLIGDVPVDMGYVLTAVADEVVLARCRKWDRYEAWADRPLEAVLYGTRIAGDRIFEAAEELAARQRSDPRAATAILLAFLTGFRGRYQGRDDRGRIADLEHRLYALVCRRDYAPDDRLPYRMPDLVATRLEGSSERSLPSLWPWLVALVALILAYFPISHLAWWEQVRTIDNRAQEIIDYNGAGPLPRGHAR
jgi:type VI secretion system protein ImpK